jgi:hypothetical protein
MEKEQSKCGICNEPMPEGEEMFQYHGLSGPCPKPIKPATNNPELEFKPLTSEEWREYTFPIFNFKYLLLLLLLVLVVGCTELPLKQYKVNLIKPDGY